MLVSYRWLHDYVEISDSPEELAMKLTDAGVIVDNVYHLGSGLDKCLIGEIKAIEKHPNADRLQVCQVDIGNEVVQIVTGATNVKVGQLVPVACVGAKLPNGTKIRSSKLRGVPSHGMLMSADEIGFETKVLSAEEKEGILIFPAGEVGIGQDVKDALELDDCLLELDLTPNRADCSSMIGLAYEVAAILGTEVRCPSLYTADTKCENEVSKLAAVKIEARDLCSQYSLRLLDSVKIVPSPLWMQNRLRKSGIRPISNIVDITNYVMLELGQPLHAFDYDKLSQHQIIVRRATDEHIITLDEIERILNEEMLVIADDREPVAIAGVMGGYFSEVTPKTSRILLESAQFLGASVRRTSRRLGLNTEAAGRFGKGIDQGKIEMALNRVAKLVMELGVADVVPGIVTDAICEPMACQITFRPERANHILGTDIVAEEMVAILERLQFGVKKQDNKLQVTVPTRRPDVTTEIDLVEEIARLHGYDRIESCFCSGMGGGALTHQQKTKRKTRQILRSMGTCEVVTYAFHDPRQFDDLQLEEDSRYREYVGLQNPLTERQSVMRTTLVPGLLQAAKHNLNRQQNGVLFSEIGRVFFNRGGGELPEEIEMLGIIAGGIRCDKTWYAAQEEYDYFAVKGFVEKLLHSHNVEAAFVRGNKTYLHPGRSADILAGERVIGYIGEIHPDVLERLSLSTQMVVAEIDHDMLVEEARMWTNFEELVPYPSVTRDLAIEVKNTVPMSSLFATIRETGGSIIENAVLFDVYEGQQVEQGNRSCAFKIKYRASDRTLTDVEVNEVHQHVVGELKNSYGAKLR